MTDFNIMRIIGLVASILTIFGAINWGLEAIGHNVVTMLFASNPTIVRVIYFIIAASGVYKLTEKLT